jgi:hypothetical protein
MIGFAPNRGTNSVAFLRPRSHVCWKQAWLHLFVRRDSAVDVVRIPLQTQTGHAQMS